MEYVVKLASKVSFQLVRNYMKRLYRNTSDAKIAGVCAGMGDYFDIDPVIIRLFFLFTLFLGCGLFVYIIAWFIVPKNPTETTYPSTAKTA